MIYIAIPAHNEANTVGALLWKIRRVMSEFERDYRILFLDDGSTDGTGAAAGRYTRVVPLEVTRHAERLGYAASVEELLRSAVRASPYPKRDVVVVLQADFTEDPRTLPSLVKRIEGGADVVVAAVRDGRDLPARVGWARRACRWGARRLGLPEEVSDPLSGYRAYRVVTLRRAFAEQGRAGRRQADGPAWNVELLARVAPHARRIDEESTSLRRDRLQRPSRFRAWALWRDLLRLWLSPPRPEPATALARVPPGRGSRARAGGAPRRRRRRAG